MASDADIANMALSHLGIGEEIASLTEKSDEARACNRFFEPCRDATLRDFPWPFATKFAVLGLVEEIDDDDATEDEWDYSYRYPPDCAKIIRIRSGSRNDSRDERVPYKIAKDTSGRLIYTDEEDATVEYIELITDPERFTPDFYMALSFRLAAMIAPRLTAGDPYKLGPRAYQMYVHEIERAKATALNEGQVDVEVDSEFIRARE